MKKILFISNITNKISNFTIPSIEAARKAGYEFHMASNFSGFEQNFDANSVIRHHIDIDRNPLGKKNFLAFKQMLALLKREKFDVIHCNTPIGGILGRVCGKIEKVPKVIYTAHGFHFYSGASFLSNLTYKTIEKLMAHFTDVLITINNEDYNAAKNFKLRNNGNIYYIPGVGVNTNEYRDTVVNKEMLKKSLGIEKEGMILISMGDLIKRKNYSVSIEALATINNPSIYYLICGQGPELENLKMLAEQRGIDKQVLFLGYRSDIRELLAISDIFLFTTSQEGLPRAMMEAMASGLPCVASKIRGNIDLITDGIGGYLCHPNDIKSFAEKINELTQNKDLRKGMGQVNLKEIKKYDVNNIKIKMKEIYNQELI